MTLKTHAQTSQHYKTIQHREKFKLKFMTDIQFFGCVASVRTTRRKTFAERMKKESEKR